ncbi:hypothetical protein A2160_03605 [Candidatus Beckwithbacteria bacterium RBG_13_42_9]|uniref:DUF8173 domain-containing protein n=1 Tax=Candidatus Beckwithbacteria bacterium RBG_13_42_9 TaxID=1797457 RepID=A0A1F5E8Y6_9BACT|nr:MAG: hypothetical protein A2160_03605 [Candidatus Beckwithbacteria bacterium RBG_13_42_9]
MKKIAIFLTGLFLGLFLLTQPVLAQKSSKDDFNPPGQVKNREVDLLPTAVTPLANLLPEEQKTLASIGGLNFKASKIIDINDEVQGDLYVVGQSVKVSAPVHGDLLIAGGKVVVSGPVDQNLRVVGGQVEVSGSVGRNATIVGGQVILADTARIAGNLALVAKEATISSKAFVAGESYIKTAPKKQVERFKFENLMPQLAKVAVGGLIALLILKLLSTLASGLLLTAIFSKCLRQMLIKSRGQAGNSLLWGLVASIVVPLVALFAFLTLIGIPLSLILFASLAIGWYIGRLIGISLVGFWLIEKLSQSKDVAKELNLYLAFLLGLVIFTILEFVPFVGWLIQLLLTWIGLGVLVKEEMACCCQNKNS